MHFSRYTGILQSLTRLHRNYKYMQNYQLDPQSVEIVGRNKLVNELLKAGIEVSLPIRDRGIDLIAYIDIDRENKLQSFVACPVQMKAATERRFSLNKKYEKFKNLLLTFVWHVNDPNSNIIYALTYSEALKVAEKLEWTKTETWVRRGKYSSTSPGKTIVDLIEPYKMTPEKWKNKVENNGVNLVDTDNQH